MLQEGGGSGRDRKAARNSHSGGKPGAVIGSAAVRVQDFLPDRMRIKTASPDLPIKSLSGGNQQKAVLSKMLLANPKVLILDEPTRGVDVGAKYEIYKLMFELVKQGVSIVMISSELPEVLGISDRVLVIGEGQLRGDLINDGLTQEQVLTAALNHPGRQAA